MSFKDILRNDSRHFFACIHENSYLGSKVFLHASIRKKTQEKQETEKMNLSGPWSAQAQLRR